MEQHMFESVYGKDGSNVGVFMSQSVLVVHAPPNSHKVRKKMVEHHLLCIQRAPSNECKKELRTLVDN